MCVCNSTWINPLRHRYQYASNNELGTLQKKSGKTIENQLGSVYDKLIGFYDFGETISDKRQALLDILRDEE